jgi:lipopolysaccharide export system protein LptA
MASGRTHGGWRAAIGLTLCLALFGGLARAQKVGVGKGIKFADYYEAPHATQMKWLLEGASAEPQAGGRIVAVTQAKVQTWRETGAGEMVVEAPECLYDADRRSVSSPGSLRLLTADGTFSLTGEGFAWLQSSSTLLVSNRVHTVVHPELAGLATASARTNQALAPTPALDIFSDQFDYAEKSGQGTYRGNVRVEGTNLSLTAGFLSVLAPRTDSRLQSLIAETNIILHYEKIHATGQRATYTVDTEQVLLTGQPTWRVEPQEGRGDELLLDRTNGVFRATGQAWLKMPARGPSTFAFLPLAASPLPTSPPTTNQFLEIQSEAYEFRTNSAVFHNQVRVIEWRGDQAQGKLSCDQLTLAFVGTNELQQMVAENQVVVEQAANRLNCGRLTLTFAGTNELQRMVAQQAVVIEQATNRFTAGEAVYAATNGLLELTENPTWRSGTREGKGERILVDVRREQMSVQTNALMRLPASEFGRSSVAGSKALPQTGPHARTDQVAEITAQDYTVGREGALFRGKVRMNHPNMQWSSGQITALAPPGGGRMNRVVAEQDVVFDLLDAKGQKVHGTGDEAVYTYGITGTTTNEAMVLTGRPAQLESTNFTGQNKVFILDLANQRLGAPGKSKYVVRDLVKTSGANQAGTPPNTLLK